MPKNAELNDGPYLSLNAIAKQFPGCLANDHVDLTIARNDIHALLGENGAGKSTLVKIIYGVSARSAGGQGNDRIVDSPPRRSLHLTFLQYAKVLVDCCDKYEPIAAGHVWSSR
jgi:ABC-type branched-subunit amino acid transport system ATPase component